MIKAVIIDDELWSRNIIKSFGNWESLGIELAGEAEDGEKGLLLIQQVHPEIIITDMNMPNINGVSLLKHLNELSIDARIIVISGYDDFEYMKQAIRSKAFEYILKPVEASELNQVLSNCVQEICLNRRGDVTLIYERIEKTVLDYLVSKRKLLIDYLEEKEFDKISLLLTEMEGYLSSISEDSKIMTRFLDDNLVNVIQENVLLPLENEETIVMLYRELRKDIEIGLTWEAYFKRLLFLLSEGVRLYQQRVIDSKKPIVVLAKEYVDAHYRENIGLEKIAKHFFTSKEYLSGAFKSKYEMNISQYILNMKMKEAVVLLTEGYNHLQISERLGYQDVNYFYKVFKKYYGCTPSAYQK